MLMLECNNLEIAELLPDWLEGRTGSEQVSIAAEVV
jgi:hypothetical protein